jgi:hypothetical protein
MKLTPNLLRMIFQIRLKQLSTEDSQNKLVQSVIEIVSESDQSFDHFSENLLNLLQSQLIINHNLDLCKVKPAEILGFPIKFNKTTIQIESVIDYIHELINQDQDIFSDIQNGKFFNKLGNQLDQTDLPYLGSDITSQFYGNGNDALSSLMLASMAHLVGLSLAQIDLRGAATSYPLYYHLYPDIATDPEAEAIFDYGSIFTTPDKKMILFGSYQFGGHRYLHSPDIFGAEDCSSSIAKSINSDLNSNIVRTMTTANLRDYYTCQNGIDLGLRRVTSFSPQETVRFEEIQSGDIVVKGGHCGLATGSNNEGLLQILAFNRDIEPTTSSKKMGGGFEDMNFVNATVPIYVLRSGEEVGRNDLTLPEILGYVDNIYYNEPDNLVKIAGSSIYDIES